jgi:hypothetical protein
MPAADRLPAAGASILLGMVFAFSLGPPARADTRALVIGIDDYAHGSPLHGAVSDAEDIASALRAVGVTDLTLRLNRDATRERLSSDWDQLVQRAQPGDTIVLTFAGHGAQEPERVPGSEDDGKDEVLLLAGFSPSGPGTLERLVDDELNQWFRRAAERDLDVIFVADACHSGTLTRSVDPRAGRQRYRFSAYGEITDDMLSLDLPPDPAPGSTAELPNLTFLAAGQEHEKVPEVELFDVHRQRAPRGALSWAFARALEGPADRDDDHRLSRDELKHFIRANVRALAEARQTPNLLPEDHGGQVILPIADLSKGVPQSAWPKPRVRVLGPDPIAVERMRDELSNIADTAATHQPDLTFDLVTRQAVSGEGDIVARDLTQSDIAAVIEKWRSMTRLKLERLGARLSTRVLPNDGTHRRGEEIRFEIDEIQLPYLVMFSISGDGTIHFHYPLHADPEQIAVDEPVSISLEVTPPFGADHIIAVTSDRRLSDLSGQLNGLDGRQEPRRAAEAVLGAIRHGRTQLGIQGLFTAP